MYQKLYNRVNINRRFLIRIFKQFYFTLIHLIINRNKKDIFQTFKYIIS